MEYTVDINIDMPQVETEVNADIQEVEFNLEITGRDGRDGKSTETYNSIYEFPNIGQAGVMYIDASENRLYRWDETDLRYYCVGSDWSQIQCISGGSANG